MSLHEIVGHLRTSRNQKLIRHLILLALLSLSLQSSPAGEIEHSSTKNSQSSSPRPNVLIVIADQWRASAFGFAGDPNVKTPNLDRLARTSVRFVNAVAGMPVCCPTRASIMTGQGPLNPGLFLNDVPLDPNAVTIAKVLSKQGYDTGYIGKWHLNGDGRSKFIPRERRQGFDYWKVLECTHDYNHSAYFGDEPVKKTWPGYDALD